MIAALQGVVEVTADLAESNGSLPPALWHDSFHVTSGLTACTPESAAGPTLGNEYGRTLPFLSFYHMLSYQSKVNSHNEQYEVCLLALDVIFAIARMSLEGMPTHQGAFLLCQHKKTTSRRRKGRRRRQRQRFWVTEPARVKASFSNTCQMAGSPTLARWLDQLNGSLK